MFEQAFVVAIRRQNGRDTFIMLHEKVLIEEADSPTLLGTRAAKWARDSKGGTEISYVRPFAICQHQPDAAPWRCLELSEGDQELFERSYFGE